MPWARVGKTLGTPWPMRDCPGNAPAINARVPWACPGGTLATPCANAGKCLHAQTMLRERARNPLKNSMD
eukprot:11187445-Lingulodinium_polyedra.AAC.1